MTAPSKLPFTNKGDAGLELGMKVKFCSEQLEN